MENLITPATFAAQKQITREWAYQLMRRGEVGTRAIAGRLFIIDNSRAWLWKRKIKPYGRIPGKTKRD